MAYLSAKKDSGNSFHLPWVCFCFVMAEREDTTLQTRTKLLLPQPRACCSNTWMPGLLLFTHAKLQLDHCHFGERIKQEPIMKEKHEIINGNVKMCWIKVALQLWWRCVHALCLCWSHENCQENMAKMFILLPISSNSFHFSPQPENLFLPLLGVNSWPDVLSWLVATNFSSKMLLWHRLNRCPSAKAICPTVTK